EIVRFNAQDAREFCDPLVRDAITSVFIVGDLPRRYVGGVSKLAHCHPAKLAVFLQALSDVCVDAALAIHRDHPCSLAPVLYPEGQVCQAHLIRSRPLFVRRCRLGLLRWTRLCILLRLPAYRRNTPTATRGMRAGPIMGSASPQQTHSVVKNNWSPQTDP